MDRVFVCSPYYGKEPERISENIKLAGDICRYFLENGAAPFAGHLIYPRLVSRYYDRSAAIRASLEFMKACNFVVVWSEKDIGSPQSYSPTMKEELAFALSLQKRIHPVVKNEKTDFRVLGDYIPIKESGSFIWKRQIR